MDCDDLYTERKKERRRVGLVREGDTGFLSVEMSVLLEELDISLKNFMSIHS